ncbi:MAG: DUF4157 domain-containing protein [Synechococcales bacterium]|nr:DUF4157 domain-containing protein [Synechococcales bacterium]
MVDHLRLGQRNHQNKPQTQPVKPEVQQQPDPTQHHSSHPIEDLQEEVGNHALGQLLELQHGESLPLQSPPLLQRQALFRGLSQELASEQQAASAPSFIPNSGQHLIQAKLTVNQPGDQYEQEADRVAAQVVQQIHASTTSTPIQPKTVQNQELMRKSESDAEEQPTQTEVEASIQAARGQGQAIPDHFRQPLEQAFQSDFSNVRIHTDEQASQLNQALQAKAFTTGRDIFFRQGEYNPNSQQGQELIAHELTHVIQQNQAPSHVDNSIQRAEAEERELTFAEKRALLEKHMAARAQQQQLISENKQGQGMAEELVRQDRSDAFGATDPAQEDRAKISDALRRLVEFSKYDDSASISVLASAEEGGLTDEQKWNLIKVNSDFMQYIKKGMTINKIIPDSTVEHIIKHLHMFKDRNDGQFKDSIRGSVAHKMNYDQGLTGAQSVSNFGLDYGGYSDIIDKEGKLVEKDKLYPHSSYVKKTGTDASGKEELEAVQNVFYVQFQLPEVNLPKVKVPIHTNIIDFAASQRKKIVQVLNDQTSLQLMAASEGAKDAKEMGESLKKKQEILDRFLAIAEMPEGMCVSRKSSGQKNEDDPLTNLGMTKPGVRLKNKFGTINQEYYLTEPVQIPPGAGLWLKDETGKDQQVGRLIEEAKDMGNGNQEVQLKWSLSEADIELINQAIKDNETFRQAGSQK